MAYIYKSFSKMFGVDKVIILENKIIILQISQLKLS